MLVPLIVIVEQLLEVILPSLRAETMFEPGIVRSGLIRPAPETSPGCTRRRSLASPAHRVRPCGYR